MDLSLLEKLCCETGVSGDEGRIRDMIFSEIRNFADEIKVDSFGNLIVFKKGRERPSKKIMISAHMDEVGFIVNDITDDGLVKFLTVGGISDDAVLGKKVLFCRNKCPGVIGSKPVHLLRSSEKKKFDSINDLYIDIGVDSKHEAEKYISYGDYISFFPNFDLNSNGIIRAKALDDRVGCFILINLIKSELPFDAYFTFVVQEEVGLRGAKTAVYQVNPDAAIVVEATTAADIPSVEGARSVCSLGEGAVISFMDRSTIYDREYFDLALSLSKKQNIKAQVKRAVAGGNDAGAINVFGSGVRTLAVSLPCRYLHSQTSMISVSDVEAVEKLVSSLAIEICK